jgi:hypothetical protein
MATKAHTRSQRVRHVLRTVSGHWLLALLSHTLATAILLVLARWLHLLGCGG